MENYDDILHLPHHRSKIRSHMSIHDRAAQFSPFAALTGFESAIAETGRLTQECPELEDEAKANLDCALTQLLERLPELPQVTVTRFVRDNRKSGGHCLQTVGQVRKIDLYRRVLTMTDGNEVPMAEILELELAEKE